MGWYNPISEKNRGKKPQIDVLMQKIPKLYLHFLNGALKLIVNSNLYIACILTGNVHLM